MSIDKADQSIILRPSQEFRIKEIRIDLDDVDRNVISQAATAKGLTVEEYLESIGQQILRHPGMAEILRIAKNYLPKNNPET